MRKNLICIVVSLSSASVSFAQQHRQPSHNGNLPNLQVTRDYQLTGNAHADVYKTVAQVDQIQAAPVPTVQGNANGARASDSKLLSTASMIGPMKDAENLFSRLQIPDDWRAEERLISTGTRESQDMIVWNAMPYTWTSPVFYHRPLYYEQPNLERHGNGPRRVFQPALSSAHFFMSTPLVPIKMLYNAPWSDIYTLGEGRPGNWVPWQTHTLIEE